ncbi:13253_t:CDS:2, partial [Gigaspora margarita]
IVDEIFKEEVVEREEENVGNRVVQFVIDLEHLGHDKIDEFRTIVLDWKYLFGVYIEMVKEKFVKGAYKLAKRLEDNKAKLNNKDSEEKIAMSINKDETRNKSIA